MNQTSKSFTGRLPRSVWTRGEKKKIQAAVKILQQYEPPEGYYLAFSGGKDSIVIYHLAQLAEVKFDAHYCVSPIDPPELHQFIRQNYPQIPWDYHARGWWKMVVKKGLPTRRSRWCCEVIKEAGGLGRVVIVGSRRAEGSARSARRTQKGFGRHSSKDITFVRPIIDWEDEDVWGYIKENSLLYCSLYDEGFKRLGCVLCPLAQLKNRKREMERFPKITKLWHLACKRLIERRLSQGKTKFKTEKELWDWWMSQ